MSHDPYSRRETEPRHASDDRPSSFRRAGYHPYEEMLRLIDREAPEPFYPAVFLQRTDADVEQVDAVLDHLAMEGLIQKVRGRSLESGAGVVLTKLGQETVRDTMLLDRLIRGEPLREGDVGGEIRQGMRTPGRPVVTYALIAINVAIFVLGMMNPRLNNWMITHLAAKSGPVQAGEWWRLLTCIFLHGGLMHVGCNMFSLYMLGRFVEPAWGRWRLLVIYLVAGWAGSCLGVQYAIDPRSGASIPLVGASGSICGLLAAIALWFLLYRKHIPQDFVRRGLFSVAINVAMLAFIGYAVPYVSNAGHIGGGIGGAAAALFLHVQRFGLPGMPRKAVALRWALGVLLLLATPVASYWQMQRAWAGKGVAKNKDRDGGRKADREDEERKEEDRKVVEKHEGDAPTGPFVRHVLLPASEAADSVLKTCEGVPLNVAKAKADAKAKDALLQRLAGNQEDVKSAQDAAQKGKHNKKRLDEGRTEALTLLTAAAELCDLAEAYLKQPSAEGKDKLKDQFEKVNKLLLDYNDLLDQLKRL